MSGEESGSAEFAAGVASATAEQAAEEAAEATEQAEAAEAAADVALDVAASAEGTAWDARIAVDELRSEILGALDEIRDGRGPAGDGAPAVPEPEKRESQPAAEPADSEPDKPKKKHLWWGTQTRR